MKDQTPCREHAPFTLTQPHAAAQLRPLRRSPHLLPLHPGCCRHHCLGHLAAVGAAPLQPAVGPHTSCLRRAAGEPVVHGALPHLVPGQGPRVLPEAAQELRAEPAAPQVGGGADSGVVVCGLGGGEGADTGFLGAQARVLEKLGRFGFLPTLQWFSKMFTSSNIASLVSPVHSVQLDEKRLPLLQAAQESEEAQLVQEPGRHQVLPAH